MATRKTRYSILHLLIGTAVCAFLVASVFMPAGYLVHLPILVALILVASLFVIVQRHRRRPQKLSFRNHWQLMLVVALMLSFVMLLLPVYGFLRDRDSEIRYAASQRDKAINISNPNEFRRIAQTLHESMLESPIEGRVLMGSAPNLPAEIAELDPVSIVASENYLFIKMSPNGSGMVIYPEGSTFGRVTGVNITRDVYYWGQ